MHLTLLGTGNAAGVPVYGCECPVCLRARAISDFRRRPCSALLEFGGERWLIDAGLPDVAERFPPGRLSGILLTHFHPDHVQGLFHLRWGIAPELPVYCPHDPDGCADLCRHPGMLRFRPVKAFASLALQGVRTTPLPLLHSKPTLGYLFEDGLSSIAYLTDTRGLPPATAARLHQSGVDVMVIDCTHPPGYLHSDHNDLATVREIHNALRPRTTVLTHLSHEMDAWLEAQPDALPAGMVAGRDMLKLDGNGVVEPQEQDEFGPLFAAAPRPARTSPRGRRTPAQTPHPGIDPEAGGRGNRRVDR